MYRYYLIPVIFLSIIIIFSCKKEEEKIYNYIVYRDVDEFTKNYIFLPGSIWIYKSDTSLIYDTVSCIYLKSDTFIYSETIPRTTTYTYQNKYYEMIVHHSYSNKIVKHYFVKYSDQLDCFYNNPIPCNFPNYYMNLDSSYNNKYLGELLKLNDTIININSTNYYSIHNQITASFQVNRIVDYDTDLYYVENIGLVKISDKYSGWSLIYHSLLPL